MEYYVGLNVGLEETGVCIINESKAVREVKVNTEPAVIRSALEGFADRLSQVSVEASSLGHWRYANCMPAASRLSSWKVVTCACHYPQRATKPTETMRVELHS